LISHCRPEAFSLPDAASLVANLVLGDAGIAARLAVDAVRLFRFGRPAARRLGLQGLSVYDHALEVLPRERVPLDWATTQNNLRHRSGYVLRSPMFRRSMRATCF
jgi:hypothetical protein